MAVAPHPALPLLTYEQYLTEGAVEGAYEIIEGVRYFMAGPSWRHQVIVGNVFELLRAFQRSARSGRALTSPFDVLIHRVPLHTRQPDALFITEARLESAGGIPLDGPLEVGPELIVEVLSPSETPRSLRDKLSDFAAVGVREAWIVSPDAETVEVRRLSPEGIETVAVYAFGQTLQSVALPGLTLAVADFFAD